jgi:type IV secretory pathway VirB4 component
MRYRRTSSSQPDIFALALRQIGAALWRLICRQLPSYFFFRRLAARIPEDARKKHTYLSGSSGSGKSELLKIFVFAQRKKARACTTILLDPNGDMASQVAHWKQNKSGTRCVLIDLSLRPGFSPVINPLQLADRSPENVDLMAQLFVSAFNEIMDSSQLTLNMKVLLHPCVSVLMELGNVSLPDLQRILDDERNVELMARA